MHFGRDAAIGAGAGLAVHEEKKRHHRAGVTETRTTRPTLMTRLKGRNANTRTVKTTTKMEPTPGRTPNTHNNAVGATGTRRTGGSRWGRRAAGGAVVADGEHHHHHHHNTRQPGIGDKINGAIMKLKGGLEGKPRKKAAGTRLMHGNNGRGSRQIL